VKFIIRPTAREDILRQYRYYLIDQDAEEAAERFLGAVRDAFKRLCKHPGVGCPKALHNPALAGLRSWPVKGFSAIRVYYLTSEKMIRVVRDAGAASAVVKAIELGGIYRNFDLATREIPLLESKRHRLARDPYDPQGRSSPRERRPFRTLLAS